MRPSRWLLLGALAACSRGQLAAIAEAPDASSAAPLRNACGGEGPLEHLPGEPCGACGRQVCAGPEAVQCDDSDPRNACGGCGPAPREECNERDDDCDGLVDEDCVRALGSPLLRAERVRVSGDHATLGPPLVVRIPEGTTQDFSAPPLPPTDGGQSYRSDTGADLDGTLVAWVRSQGPPSVFQLVARDLAAGPERVLAQVDGGWLGGVSVDQGRVAFEQSNGAAGSDRDVWLWDPAAGVARALTGRGLDESGPALSGEWLVYEQSDSRGGVPRRILARNLRTSEELPLSEGLDGYCFAPTIDGARVVFVQAEQPNGQSGFTRLHLYDLGTRRRTALTTLGRRFGPRLSGSLLCWSGGSASEAIAGSPGVTALDLATGRSMVLSAHGQGCDLSGRRTAFLEYSSSYPSGRAYFRDLLPQEP